MIITGEITGKDPPLNVHTFNLFTLLHHRHKFLVIDASVAVGIRARYQLTDIAEVGALHWRHLSERFFKLFDSNGTVTILVKVVKRTTNGICRLLLGRGERSRDELFVIELAAAVNVDRLHNRLELLHRRTGVLDLQTLAEFVDRNRTRVVGVEALEEFLQASDFFRGHGASHGHQSHLLELGDAGKVLETLEHDVVELLGRSNGRVRHPRVRQHLSRGEAFLRVGFEHARDELLRFGAHLGPRIARQVEVASQNCIKDPLLGLRPEWGHTREKNVEDDTARPDVRGVAVATTQNFGSDVVRASDEIRKDLVLTVERGQTEINGADRRIRRAVLEHKVFRLQVAVHDAQLVAVINALHNRAQRFRRILFTILALFDNAIEQFTTRQEFHDDIHVFVTLIRTNELDNILVPRKMVQNPDLVPHVFNILGVLKLALGNRLTRALTPGSLLRHQERRTKLTTS
mmetsp:Transcript_1040/g.3256  ORF Transcript_1040/g.3256 Transcript_1040/m.3256 type:complete len:460 (-) Transcript_1040:174-1553(-)